MLASIHRGLEQTAEERVALTKLESISSDCLDALLRLIEIDSEAKDEESVLRWSLRVCEINPLRSDIHERLAHAAEILNRPEAAIASWSALLEMDPIDPAKAHFHLAKNYAKLDKRAEAKQHVLFALEESPRYRDALRLLLTLNDEADESEGTR